MAIPQKRSKNGFLNCPKCGVIYIQLSEIVMIVDTLEVIFIKIFKNKFIFGMRDTNVVNSEIRIKYRIDFPLSSDAHCVVF